MGRAFVLGSALAFTFAPATPLHALQDASAADSLRVEARGSDTIPEYRLPGVIVAPRRATLSSGGASVIELSLEPGRVAPSLSLGEALRDAPLIQIRTNSRGEEQPSLRGAGSRQVAVLFDGVPLTLGWDHRTDLSVVPLQGVTRMTIHRGLSSLLFGPNILGGVVEVSVSGGEGEGGARWAAAGSSTRLAAGWESSGGWRMDADASTHLESGLLDWTFRGGVGARRNPGHTLPAGARGLGALEESLVADADGLRLNSDLERAQGFFSMRADGVDGGWGALSLSGHSTQRGVPPEAHTAEPRFWRYPDQDELLLVLSGGRAWDGATVGPASVSSTLGVQAGSTELESFQDHRYLSTVERQRDEDVTTSLRITGRLGAGDVPVVRSALTLADIRHREGSPGGPFDRFQQRLWSLGSELEAPLGTIGGSIAPKLGAGLVWDGATTPRAGPWEPVGSVHAWGARAGLSLLVGASGTVVGHASVSRRARIPSLREMYSGALGRFLPNPDLGPEVQTAAEAGATVRLGSGEVQALAFVQRVEDGIVRVSVEQGEGRVLQRVNRDRVRAAGVELLASARGGPFELEGDLTLQRVRVFAGPDVPAERAEYEPAVQGSLTAGASVLRLLQTGAHVGSGGSARGFELQDPRMSASLRFTGAQHCLDPAAGTLDRLDPAALVDLGAEVPVGLGGRRIEGLSFGARVANVTNALSFDQCGLPRPGRTFELTLRVR